MNDELVLRLRLTVGAIDRDRSLAALDNALHGQQIRATPRLVPDPMLDEAMEGIEENTAKADTINADVTLMFCSFRIYLHAGQSAIIC